MWVLGWPFIPERVAKQAREWGFASQELSDDDASVIILGMIFGLEHSEHVVQYVEVDMDGEWRPIIALCRDEKADKKEDAEISRDKIPPFRTCVKIQRCLGVPVGEAPEWYWTDGEDID